MFKRDSNDKEMSETGNWNVADSYSKAKIMRPLVLCDYYEDVARFGFESLIDELTTPSEQLPSNDIIKLKALKRLIRELIRLIDNSKFALKKKGTRNKALSYKSELLLLEKIIPKLIKTYRDEMAGTTIIKISDNLIFEQLINMVSTIKSKINEPLNENHLIFIDKEEFDPKAFKDGLKERMINKG